jgi:hypothetical protein
MKHDMEQGMRYIVTKDSNDGTFVVGDKIELLHDNAVGNWTVEGWIDAVDVPEATAGMEVEIDTVWLNRKKDVLLKQLDQLNRKARDAK